MATKKILVFPCGSEVALEIYRSLQYSIHFDLIGANSVDDHGKFIFKNYIGNLPFAKSNNFIPEIKKVVQEKNIDAIFPAMDSIIDILKQHESEIGCKVISSSAETTSICLSKFKTYQKLSGFINTPVIYDNLNAVEKYPVFLKPDIGYGSRGVKKINDINEGKEHLKNFPQCLVLEYLPGKEFTIDCFTDYKGELLFCGARERKRIVNGISVNTSTQPSNEKITLIAEKINHQLKLNGAWFFQLKERENGELVLMEVAARLGGSSSVYRVKGVNFALLSAFNAFEIPVSLLLNDYEVELDRALDCKFKIDLKFNHVYTDFDDVVIMNGKVNTDIIQFLYNFINEGKKLHLITKHDGEIEDTLKKYRLQNLFDEVIHLNKDDQKWKFIMHKDAIFIDDSHAERKEVKNKLGINVFAPDMLTGVIFNS